MSVDPPSDPSALLGANLREALDQHGTASRLDALVSRLLHLQRLTALGAVGAGVIHEARNVMTGILGFAQVGAERAESAETTKLFRLVEKESIRCLGLLSSYLGVARDHAAPPQRVSVADLVESTAVLVRGQFRMNRVQLDVEADPNAVVRGRANELKQVLLNLLVNALEATPSGGTVRITAARDATGRVTIAVSDSGEGIPSELLARVLEPFVTSKENGVGLGLSVSNQIVESHGGTLEVTSVLGSGATFTVLLPPATG